MKRYMTGKKGAIVGYKLDESTVKGFISDLPMAWATRVRPALALRPTRSSCGSKPTIATALSFLLQLFAL